MRSPERITQRNVAKRAGVSQATVSTLLNGRRDLLALETAARIDAAIADLGYRPNRFAQALRTRKSMVIACVVPDLTNPFYPALFRAAQEVLGAAGYDMVAINTDGRADAEAAAIAGAEQGRYDGVFGVFFNSCASDFAAMLEVGVPLVRIEATYKKGGALAFDDLFVDNKNATYEATKYLISLAHRQIAMIAGEGGPQRVRVEGYCDALKLNGIKASIWLDPSYTYRGGRRAAEQMLDLGERPTGVLAANDLMAIGAMQVFAERGLSVPDDISVIGFDDIMAASLVTPPLTTVALHQVRLGVKAAELLLDRIVGPQGRPGRAIELPYEIISRGSVSSMKVPAQGGPA
jgi:LacI family transcriptional regulator